MTHKEVLKLFLDTEQLPSLTQIYLLQLFDGTTSRRNLLQIRTRRNKEGKLIEAGNALLALQLHTLAIDHLERLTDKGSN